MAFTFYCTVELLLLKLDALMAYWSILLKCANLLHIINVNEIVVVSATNFGQME
jgi:hypothetical protein